MTSPRSAARERDRRRPASAARALLAVLALAPAGPARGTNAPGAPPVPVLVELFTSEGCSSCPPADALLARLVRTQPVAGAEIVALGLHVDYWDRLGWKDPFSSPLHSARQKRYAERLGSDRVSTPQAVVDGAVEIVGSDERRLVGAVAAAARSPKAPVRLSAGPPRGKRLPSSVRIDALAASAGDVAVFVALVEDARATDVRRGENAGRRLEHAAVVRSLAEIGRPAGDGRPFEWQGEIPATTQSDSLVVFAQERRTGRVLAVGRLRLVPAR